MKNLSLSSVSIEIQICFLATRHARVRIQRGRHSRDDVSAELIRTHLNNFRRQLERVFDTGIRLPRAAWGGTWNPSKVPPAVIVIEPNDERNLTVREKQNSRKWMRFPDFPVPAA